MKIEIIESCYGPDVRVDNDSLFKSEYDKRDDIEVSKLKDSLISELSSLKDHLDMMDWRYISEIIVSRGKYKYIESDSYQDSCGQCGNYNTKETYQKIMDND